MEESSEDWQLVQYKDYDTTSVIWQPYVLGSTSESWAVQESTNHSSLTSLNKWPSTRNDENQ